jgi:hypothetical protein
MDIVWLAAVAAVWVVSAETLVRLYRLDKPRRPRLPPERA